MKKNVLLAVFLLFSIAIYSQKKKATTTKTTTTAALAKVDNLLLEVKKSNFQLTITENGKEKEAIIIKPADAKFAPTLCKLTGITASGTKLYVVSWTEVTQIKNPKKTEDITQVYTVIYEITTKKQVFSNTQTTNHITEIVTLGGTTATETQEKIRRDGFELILNADGSVSQKGKKQEIKWVYDVAKMEYIVKK